MYITTRLGLLVVLGMFAIASVATPNSLAQSTSTSVGSPVDRLDELSLAQFQSGIPVYASLGSEQRGEELGALLAEAVDFYERELGVRLELALVVLNEEDWAAFTPVPYGFPHYVSGTPDLAVLGALTANEAADDLRAREQFAPAADRARVEDLGYAWDEASGKVIDLVGLHELGHIYVRALGIEPHNRWFSEMLATYIGYAFMRLERPELAVLWDSVIGAVPSSPRPDHESLADFERLYVGVGTSNYTWYQGVFHLRAQEVFEHQGLDFLRRLGQELPADASARLATDQLLARLERIEPGFHAWAERLGLITN